jgi:hypothetical protein
MQGIRSRSVFCLLLLNSSSWRTGNNALLLYVVSIRTIAREAISNTIFIPRGITTIFILEINKKHHILLPIWNIVAFKKREASLTKPQIGSGFHHHSRCIP